MSNIWTYIKGNQISYQLIFTPSAIEKYLAFILTDAYKKSGNEDKTTDIDIIKEGEKLVENKIKVDK